MKWRIQTTDRHSDELKLNIFFKRKGSCFSGIFFNKWRLKYHFCLWLWFIIPPKRSPINLRVPWPPISVWSSKKVDPMYYIKSFSRFFRVKISFCWRCCTKSKIQYFSQGLKSTYYKKWNKNHFHIFFSQCVQM